MGKVKIGNFKGPQGETGPQGPAGPRGPEGPQGPMGEVDANTQIVFAQAARRENIASGEKLNIILGKIKKWFADIKGAAFQDVSNTLTTTEEGKVLDARQGKVLDEKVAEKLDKTDVVNGLTETAEGKALDARQGKVLDEKVSDLNSKLNLSSEELDDGITITRCGRHRVLQISNAESPVAGDIVRLPDGDIPSGYVMGSATYRGQTQGDYFISITPKGASTPGKVGLFRGNNAEQTVSGPYIVAHIDWYVNQ